MDNVLKTQFYGANQDYEKSLILMHEHHKALCLDKSSNFLMLLEYKPVITYTRQHGHKSITSCEKNILADNIALCEADRGGDVTFHGPGQLVGYPIIKLKNVGANSIDVSFYMKNLQNALLNSCFELGIADALLLPGKSGIWIKTYEHNLVKLKKLIAIGVGLSNGVTKHGFAFNIDIDYSRYVKHITPCGLKGCGVITMKEIFNDLNQDLPNYESIWHCISKNVASNFGLTLKFGKI